MRKKPMRLIILAGFAKTDAHGNPDLTSRLTISAAVPGSDEARELAANFSGAKQSHNFPKGVRWLGFGSVETTEAAAFISADLAEQIAGLEGTGVDGKPAHGKTLAGRAQGRGFGVFRGP